MVPICLVVVHIQLLLNPVSNQSVIKETISGIPTISSFSITNLSIGSTIKITFDDINLKFSIN